MSKDIIFFTCLICLSCSTFAQSHDAQWVDPHEMTINNVDVKKFVKKHDEVETTDCNSNIPFALEHYKRLITFILNNAAFDDISSSYKGQLKLNIPSADHKFLLHFIRENVDEDASVLRKIDQIMSRILSRSKLEHFTDFLISWTDYVYFTFCNRTTIIILSCTFLLLISYKLLRSNFTIWSVTKYLIFIGWVVDFVFRWIDLLQKAEINKLADGIMYKTVPLHCDPDKMSMWQYLWYSVSTSEECRQYHQTIYGDIFWSVAPLTVLSHQLGIIIYTPSLHIGKAVGSFTSGILTTLPWGVNVVLLPVLLLFALLIIGILLSFSTETSFQLNFFHLFKFNFGNRERAAVGDALTGRNLTAIMDIVHRNMIEDVRPTASQDSNTEQCACSAIVNEKESITNKDNLNIPEKLSDSRQFEKGNGDN